MNKNKIWLFVLIALFSCTEIPSSTTEDANKNQEDPYLWLEKIEDEQSLSWVQAQNTRSIQSLEHSPHFEPIHQRLLSILNSNERIPSIQKAGNYCYNVWRDDSHVRGLLRRTTLEEYAKEPITWENVLDLDALAEAENENWTLKELQFLYPSYDRLIISLSRGGADATVVREFDLDHKKFVPEGFYLPEAKSSVCWKDKNTLYVGTNFGPDSLTDSGYPKMVKEWTRGTPLTEAKLIFEGDKQDVFIFSWVAHDHGHAYEAISQAPTLFENNVYLKRDDQWVKIDKPADARLETYGEHLLLTLQSDWTVKDKTYPAGALLALECEKYLEGDRSFHVLFEPTEKASLDGTSSTKNYLILNILEKIRNKIVLYRCENGVWVREDFDAPLFGSVGIGGIDPDESDAYFMEHSDYLTPTSLWMGDLANGSRIKLKSLPSYFDSSDLQIEQHEALSKDGTKIPYFQVSKKGMPLDNSRPTLLYGYGGFQVSLQPSYHPIHGAAWLEQGGVYVEANIRGGGEFGPKWHQAARKENKQCSYDDFIAVAEDLIARGVTSPNHLGIQGGSNGGLLMGVMLTQRPELWKAVLCHVPLLDMKRYHKLLAGASWMSEYGDPDKEEEWAFLEKYSPYHNLREDVTYPLVFFTTSTRDDRVHPGHARKMAAKMLEQGCQVLYYENTEGGHAGAANNKQIAYQKTLEFMFLNQQLR